MNPPTERTPTPGQPPRRPSPAEPNRPRRAPGRLAPGRRVYAIGDVHGCLDRLRDLHVLITADLAARPIAAPTLIHLGDLIDRGPDSAGVLAYIATLSLAGLGDVTTLKGNHEAMALAALASGRAEEAEQWLLNGGGASLASFGILGSDPPSTWATRIPAASMALLNGLTLTRRLDNYLFVHAGIRPNLAIDAQTEEDLLWIRGPFLNHDGPLPAFVVHGHTPRPAPEVTANRIGIDTGAVMGGWLTCAVLEAQEVRFLQA